MVYLDNIPVQINFWLRIIGYETRLSLPGKFIHGYSTTLCTLKIILQIFFQYMHMFFFKFEKKKYVLISLCFLNHKQFIKNRVSFYSKGLIWKKSSITINQTVLYGRKNNHWGFYLLSFLDLFMWCLGCD